MGVFAIAAMDENRGMGFKGRLPWHYKADLQLFKSLTSGQGLVMGRKTFESLPGLLPNRGHFVVSRQHGLAYDVPVFTSIELAIAASKAINSHTFIIGGAEIYSQCFDLVDVFYLTRINKTFEVDTYMPSLPDKFKLECSFKLQQELTFEVYRAKLADSS